MLFIPQYSALCDHSWTQTPHRIFGAACVYYAIAGLLPLVVQFLLAWQGRIYDDPNVAAYREARSQDLKRWDEYRQLVAQRKKGLISQQEFEEKKRIPVTELISDERG
jgi:hypothetical protein